jgi:hypothetical protein
MLSRCGSDRFYLDDSSHPSETGGKQDKVIDCGSGRDYVQLDPTWRIIQTELRAAGCERIRRFGRDRV